MGYSKHTGRDTAGPAGGTSWGAHTTGSSPAVTECTPTLHGHGPARPRTKIKISLSLASPPLSIAHTSARRPSLTPPILFLTDQSIWHTHAHAPISHIYMNMRPPGLHAHVASQQALLTPHASTLTQPLPGPGRVEPERSHLAEHRWACRWACLRTLTPLMPSTSHAPHIKSPFRYCSARAIVPPSGAPPSSAGAQHSRPSLQDIMLQFWSCVGVHAHKSGSRGHGDAKEEMRKRGLKV